MIYILAALAPFAQSSKEISAVLNDPRLYQRLGPERIEQILHVDNGYTVSTRSQTIQVIVRYLPVERPGPAKFELDFP